MNYKYIIYLAGKSEVYSSLQKHLELIYPLTKKSSLGMHCTLFPFYSESAEDILIKRFYDVSSISSVLTHVENIRLFDNESIVMKLFKTPVLEDIHSKYLLKFFKHEYDGKDISYIGEYYNPHLTLGHVAGITSIEYLPSYFNVKDEIITLDKIVLARRQDEAHKWNKLAEKILE